MTEEQFHKDVLDGVTAAKRTADDAKTKSEQILTDVGNLSKETKKALEDLTLVKNHQNDMAKTLEALQKFQLAMKREQRMAFGDPIQRIVQDEEMRTQFNLMVRETLSKGDDLIKLCAPMRKALGEDSSPGSTLINTALAQEIYDSLALYGKWNTLGVRRMGTKLTKLPLKTVRPVAGFILTESDTISDDTNKAGSDVTLEVELIAVLLNVSLQLLQDSEFDVTRDVMEDFIDAFNYRLDWAAFRADGGADSTDGGFTGLFEFGTAAAAGNGNISIETTDLEDWVRCLTSVDPVVLERSAKWWMHPTNLARLCLVRDENGRPLFQTALEAPAGGKIGSILGYPVEMVHVAPSTNAASSKIAAFGDPNAFVVGSHDEGLKEGGRERELARQMAQTVENMAQTSRDFTAPNLPSQGVDGRPNFGLVLSKTRLVPQWVRQSNFDLGIPRWVIQSYAHRRPVPPPAYGP